MAANGAATLCSTVTTIFVARKLSPSTYGVFSITFIFVNLWAITSDPGLNLASIGMAGSDREKLERLSRTTMGMSMVYGPVISVLICLTGWAVYGGTHDNTVILGIVILVPSLLAATVVTSLNPILQAHVRLGRSAWIEASSTAVILAGSVVVLLVDRNILALIAVSSISGLLAMGAILLVVRRVTPSVMPIFERTTSRQIFRYALPLVLNLAVLAIYARLDAFMLSALSTSTQVGEYTLGYRIYQALSIVPGIMAATAYTFLASLVGTRGQRRLFQRRATELWEVVVVLAVVVACAGAPLSGIVIRVVGGSAFMGAAPAMRLLFVATGASFVASVGGYLLVASEKRQVLLWFSMGILVVNGLINLALIPRHGASGAAVALLVAEAAAAVVATAILVVIDRLRVRVAFMLQLAVLAGAVLGAAYLTRNLGDVPRVACVVGVAAAGAIVLRGRDVRELVAGSRS